MGFTSEWQMLFSLHGFVSLVILSMLELVLGVDNIIFISLLLTEVPEEKRFHIRTIGLSFAFIMRAILLCCIVWLSRLTTTLFSVSGINISIRDVLFFIGGAYLIINTIQELLKHIRNIHIDSRQRMYKSIVLQIVVVDVLFSFDSIFAAIGIIPNLVIMILAVGIGMIFMMYLAGKASGFIEKNPMVKTLALLFIVTVGLTMMLEAFHIEFSKRYIYIFFAVAFILERAFNRLMAPK